MLDISLPMLGKFHSSAATLYQSSLVAIVHRVTMGRAVRQLARMRTTQSWMIGKIECRAWYLNKLRQNAEGPSLAPRAGA